MWANHCLSYSTPSPRPAYAYAMSGRSPNKSATQAHAGSLLFSAKKTWNFCGLMAQDQCLPVCLAHVGSVVPPNYFKRCAKWPLFKVAKYVTNKELFFFRLGRLEPTCFEHNKAFCFDGDTAKNESCSTFSLHAVCTANHSGLECSHHTSRPIFDEIKMRLIFRWYRSLAYLLWR